jgi:hypothetical protein
MQVKGMELVSNTVDYVTATSYESKLSDGQSTKRFFGVGLTALEEEIGRGNDKLPFKLQSFVGWSVGQATVATVGQAVLVRLSGDCAERHFRKLYPDATNVSRIDCQGTFRMNGAWRDMSYVHLDEVRDYAKKYKPRLKVARIDGGKDGNSLIIGKRVSDIWLRAYDKHAESREERWQDCWRYEAELKRTHAEQAASYLGGCDQSEYDPFAVASYYFRSSGVSLIKPGLWSPKVLGETRPDSDARRLQWLKMAVGPTVRLLCSHGKSAQVAEALLGSESDPSGLNDSSDGKVHLTKEELWQALIGK